MPMFTKDLQTALNIAVTEAIERNHEYLTLEHLLLALLDDPATADIIRNCGGNIDRLRSDLEAFFKEHLPPARRVPQPMENPIGQLVFALLDDPTASEIFRKSAGDVAALRTGLNAFFKDRFEDARADGEEETDESEQVAESLQPLLLGFLEDEAILDIVRQAGGDLDALRAGLATYFSDPKTGGEERTIQPPEQTAAFHRVIEHAFTQAQSSGQRQINGGNILAAMFGEENAFAVYLLKRQGVTRLDVISYISHGIRKDDDAPLPTENDGGDDDEGAPADPLEAYTVNLTQRAADGKIDPLIGRRAELERTIQVLCRRRKNNPLYVGDPGVGKTAIAEGLAMKIHEGTVPEPLRDAEIFSLDLGLLLAGTRYRGDFEQRMKRLIAALKRRPKCILFIDEIHNIVSAGAVNGGTMDASNMLKPALAAGDLRCIGSTTYQEYKQAIEKDRALARRFQKIEIGEPSVEEAEQILHGLKDAYEAHHGITYAPEALKAAAQLSAKHINDRFLPDKAIDVIDEAGAAIRLLPVAERPQEVVAHDIEKIVASIAKIPAKSVSVSERDRIVSLEPDLKSVIYGQNKAVEQVVSAIKISRAGLGHPTKPIGSFLFSGPTGVGKTELAKQLALTLGVAFLRYDMSEYMEKHTVSRLIGAPPGYVGFDQGGLLTDAVTKHPYSVVVLDEIEKAHPDVFNILLQVMDSATLTDNNGKKADFRNVILIMTTNAGAKELSAKAIGFKGENAGQRTKGAVERTFSPEFRNRLDAWIVFEPLDFATIERVVDKFVAELQAQLTDKHVTLDLTELARKWLAEKGFDKQYGARPMGRLIHEKLKQPLANEILFGSLNGGGTTTIELKDGELALVFHPRKVENFD